MHVMFKGHARFVIGRNVMMYFKLFAQKSRGFTPEAIFGHHCPKQAEIFHEPLALWILREFAAAAISQEGPFKTVN